MNFGLKQFLYKNLVEKVYVLNYGCPLTTQLGLKKLTNNFSRGGDIYMGNDSV
jgi:hypothetical protein